MNQSSSASFDDRFPKILIHIRESLADLERYVTENADHGGIHQDAAWAAKPIINQINKILAEYTVYSNQNDVIDFVTGPTKEYKTIETLRVNQRRDKDLLESIEDGFMALDCEWRFTYINQRAASNVGYEPEELIGKNIWEMFPSILRTDHEVYYRRVMAEREFDHFEIDGILTGKSYDIRIFPSRDGITVYWVDITLRKQMEEKIKEAERKYRDLVLYAPVGIYEIDFRKQRYTSVNDAMCLLTGYSREELMGMNPLEILDEESRLVFKERIKKWLVGEKPTETVDYRVLAKDGHEIYAELNVTFTVDEQGKPLGATVIGYDVTERRKGELALEAQKEALIASNEELAVANEELSTQQGEILRSRQKYATILKTMQSGFWMVDLKGKVLEVNEACCHMSGYSQNELLKMHIHDLEANENPDEIVKRIQLIIKQGHQQFESRFCRKDGSFFDVDIRTSYLDLDEGRIVAFFWDITDRKRMEQALRDSQSRLETVFAAIPNVILEYDANGKVVRANEAALKAAGLHSLDFSRDQAVASLKFKHLDGSSINKEDLPTSRALRGEHVNGDGYWIQTADGKEHIISTYAAPIRKANGEVDSVVATWIDITESKQLELKLQQANDQLERRVKERTGELESANEELLVAQEELHANNIELKIALETEKSLRDQLIQAEKFSALTRLVGSVAHEINNPLQTVKNCLYLIQSETDAAERNEALKMAVSETQRIGNLVQQLRQTYRPSSYEQVDFNLMDILNKVSVLLEPQFKQSHVIWQIHTLQDSITLHGVPDQIQQVFINICLNAIDAMCTTSGKLDLSISQPLDKKQVCISFHDTGTGIPLENQSRIFEPFFTTKVKGTGLGLAICYEIVKSHGGSISVESQPRQGTTFSVWLPVNS